MTMDIKLTMNFSLSEFKGVYPDKRLIFILQWLRTKTGAPVHITDSVRTTSEHVERYMKLEKENKIPTLGNGLGTKPLIEVIPWESRHLCEFNKPELRAVDIVCDKKEGGVYTGLSIYKMVKQAIASPEMLIMLDSYDIKDKEIYTGVGIGRQFIHLDIDRERNVTWGYGY